MPSQRAYGYSKISDASVIRQEDETGRPTYEAVQILDEEDNWYLVELKHADPAGEELAARYRRQGWTDDRCVYMGKVGAEI